MSYSLWLLCFLKSKGNFFFQIYLGGVPTFNVDGITVRHNFTGCLENVVFEGSKMISDAKNRIPGYTVGNSQIAAMFACKVKKYCSWGTSFCGLWGRPNHEFGSQ